jgi:phospholipase C
MKRRDLHHVALGVASAALLAGCGSTAAPPLTQSNAPASPIRHIVILVQENRSFDNLFAGFPGADSAMQGLCKPELPKTTWCKTEHEVPLSSVKLESNHEPGGKDICHSHQCFEIECDRDAVTGTCRLDGFDLIDKGEVQTGVPAKNYAYRYVDRSESKPYWDLARQYALTDHMFSTDTASSFIAHQELISGTVALDDDKSLTDQPDDGTGAWGCDAPPGTQTPLIFRDGRVFEPPRGRRAGPPYLPFPCFTQYKTMADLFDAGNTTWKYYVWWMTGEHADSSGDTWNGFDAIKDVACPTTHSGPYGPICDRGKDWSHMSFPSTNVFSDIKAGTLPQVSWVIPTLCDSDHPGSGANRGPLWVTEVVNALGTSAYWKNTAIILLWDDWGGWYDNVSPEKTSYTSLGFRVPVIVISPYAKPHYVSHTQYDFGSILKLIEQTFGLGSLGTSDVGANSMDDLFDFRQRPIQFKSAPLPHVKACPKNYLDKFIEENGAPPG